MSALPAASAVVPRGGNAAFTVAFNHDGFRMLDELYSTPRTPQDARRVLVEPLEGSAVVPGSVKKS